MPAPIAPNQSEQIQILLSPSLSQSLGQFVGSLAVNYGSTGLLVPLSVTVVSNQHGSLSITVSDDLTSETSAAPHVANATIELINPLTDVPVATTTSDGTGVGTLANITAGTYQLVVTALKHSTYSNPFTIEPGSNSANVFIQLQTVTYTWTVVPTQFTDVYTIQLQADFLVDIPAPNLVFNTPFVAPLLSETQSTEIYETITNHGLIQATDVAISASGNAAYTLTPLVTSIPVLPAQSEFIIPVIVTANTGITVASVLANTSDCCPLPELDVKYGYTSAAPVIQERVAKVDPVFVTTAHFNAISKDWGGSTPSFNTLAQDLFNAPNTAFLQDVITNASGDLVGDQPQLLAALANGFTGSSSTVAALAANLLTGLCNLTNATLPPQAPEPPQEAQAAPDQVSLTRAADSSNRRRIREESLAETTCFTIPRRVSSPLSLAYRPPIHSPVCASSLIKSSPLLAAPSPARLPSTIVDRQRLQISKSPSVSPHWTVRMRPISFRLQRLRS